MNCSNYKRGVISAALVCLFSVSVAFAGAPSPAPDPASTTVPVPPAGQPAQSIVTGILHWLMNNHVNIGVSVQNAGKWVWVGAHFNQDGVQIDGHWTCVKPGSSQGPAQGSGTGQIGSSTPETGSSQGSDSSNLTDSSIQPVVSLDHSLATTFADKQGGDSNSSMTPAPAASGAGSSAVPASQSSPSHPGKIALKDFMKELVAITDDLEHLKNQLVAAGKNDGILIKEHLKRWELQINEAGKKEGEELHKALEQLKDQITEAEKKFDASLTKDFEQLKSQIDEAAKKDAAHIKQALADLKAKIIEAENTFVRDLREQDQAIQELLAKREAQAKKLIKTITAELEKMEGKGGAFYQAYLKNMHEMSKKTRKLIADIHAKIIEFVKSNMHSSPKNQNAYEERLAELNAL
ncbi:MAG: hypothetical protein HQM09_08840 [Candidatus Riflebacteria bacterium]|nr:hypothetical protein [Candidatus Riflebacteria bacterium]